MYCDKIGRLEVLGTQGRYAVSMCSGVYEQESLARALCGIHNAGFEHVELTCVVGYAEHVVPERMREEDYEILERLLRDFNLDVRSISGHADLVGKKSTIPGVKGVFGPDKALELWRNRIDLAVRLGTTVVNNSVGELETEEDYDAFYKYIRLAEDYCSDRGVKIALETHGSMTGKKFRPLMEKLNSKWIGINYDTANVRYYQNIQAEDDIENVIDWIFNIHMKDHIGSKGDFNFPAVGDGEVHFHQIFRILKKHDWKGPVSAEIEYEGPDAPKRPPETIDTDVKRSYDYATRLLERY